MVTAEPFAARPDGLVPITEPLAMSLLCTEETLAILTPSVVSTPVAVVTESLVTTGIEGYRPEVSHQPPSPSPMPRARISATTASRGLNSHRCRNGSCPPAYRPRSSRCTTSVRELTPSRSGRPDGQTPDGPVPGGPPPKPPPPKPIAAPPAPARPPPDQPQPNRPAPRPFPGR